MVTQSEMLREHIINGYSKAELVSKYDTNDDRVRGTLSKAWDNIDAVSEVLKASLTGFKGQESYRLSQQKIITESDQILNDFQGELMVAGGTKLAVFASDQHLPYIRMDYFDLLLQILEFFSGDIAYYSALNDLLDFESYGKWETEPHEKKELFTSNMQYTYTMASIVQRAVNRKIPHAKMIGLLGNHDIRILKFLRKVNDGYSERRVLEFMKVFQELGVLQFENGSKQEPIVHISVGLKWVHGVSAASSNNAVAMNTIKRCAGSDLTGDAGVLYHTVTGHVHRGFTGDFMGVTHANSGCGSTLKPQYMKHAPNHWNLGIVISEIEVAGRGVESTVINFKRKGTKLVAQYKGVNFDTQFDETNYFLK